MGLISEYAWVILNSNNCKHFEELGYEIPRSKDNKGRMRIKRGTKIYVKTKDLLHSSTAIVKVQCDNCKEIFEMTYDRYNQHSTEDGKFYCGFNRNRCVNQALLGGDKSPNWNPNKTNEERINGRKYPEYREFIKKVLVRDNYTCQCCGNKINHDGIVHHLDGYNWCVEKRTDETNGITLCENCHKNFHSVYGNGNNTKEQFEEWIGRAVGELEKYNGKLTTARKVYCIETKTVYDSAKICAEKLNMNSYDGIYDVCNGKLKTTYEKHFLWLNKAIELGYIKE